MLFEPEALVLMAKRAGIRLYRNGELLEARREAGIPKVWAETLRLHKPDLLPILPDMPAHEARRPAPGGDSVQPAEWTPATGGNFELFGPPPMQQPRPRRGRATPPAHRRPSGQGQSDLPPGLPDALASGAGQGDQHQGNFARLHDV